MREERGTGPVPRKPIELAEGYYADNFRTVLDTVVARYDDLLTAAERALAESWYGGSLGAQRLYVRLISRKGPCFRRDRLEYAEIPALDDALAELAEGGLLDDGAEAPPAESLGVLLRPELDALARELGEVPGSRSKDELIGSLVAGYEVEDLRAGVARRCRVVRPLGHEVLRVFRLLFFGNLSQDWTEFVLRDLGVMRWEPYPLRRELRLFEERRAVDDQLASRELRSTVGLLLSQGQLEPALELATGLSEKAWHAGAERFRDQVVARIARALERADRLPEALDWYARSERPPARERRIRVLEKLGRWEEALALAGQLADDPRDESEAVFAPRMFHRLRRALGEELGPWRRPRRLTRDLELVRRAHITVEQQVLEHLAEQGRGGFFAENWLWKSLFGLAFWDILFAPLPGAFQHPFQLGPLDLHGDPHGGEHGTGDFRARRRDAIEARLAALRVDPDPGPALLARWDEKYGTANFFVTFFDGARDLLALALERLHGRHLAAVCDRLVRDPRRYRRGLPDLFVLRDEAPGFELLEVKAPGDQLRPEQGAWIDYLGDSGIPAAILKVRWSEADQSSSATDEGLP